MTLGQERQAGEQTDDRSRTTLSGSPPRPFVLRHSSFVHHLASSVIQPSSLIVLLLAAFALRLFQLASQPIWWDEGFSADLARDSLVDLTARTAADIHPPLYYYLLHFWVGPACESEFSLRFLSVIIGVVLVALLQRAACKWFGRATALAATFVAALSPLYLAYSQEARMYLLEALLVLATALVAARLLAGSSHRRQWLVYVVLASLSLYADYFSALSLIALNILAAGIFLLRSLRRAPETGRLFWKWSVAQIAVTLLYLPWLGIAAGQIGGYGVLKSTAPPPLEIVRQTLLAFNFGPAFNPASRWPLFVLALVAALGLAAAIFVEARNRRVSPHPDPLPRGEGASYEAHVPGSQLDAIQSAHEGTVQHRGDPESHGLREGVSKSTSNEMIQSPTRANNPFSAFEEAAQPSIIANNPLSPWERARVRATPPDNTQHPMPANNTGLYLILGMLILPALIFLAVMYFRPFFHIRYLMIATPFYYLLLGASLAGLWRAFPPAGLAAIAGLILVFGLGARGYFFDPAYAKDDTRAVGRILASELGPGDLALWQTQQPFWYYYRGPARAAFLPADLSQVGPRLTNLAKDRRRVAWAEWKQGDNDPWNVVPYLLSRAGQKVSDHVVRGYRIRFYDLARAPEFHLDVFDPPAGPNRFGDAVEIAGVQPPTTRSLPADGAIAVGLRLRIVNSAPPGTAYKAFLHLLDDRGALLGQVDSYLYSADRKPSWAVAPGEATYAFLVLNPPPATSPGEYRLEIGVYEAPADSSAPSTPETMTQIGLVGGSRAVYDLGSVALQPPQRPWTAEQVTIARPLELTAPGVRLLGLDRPSTNDPPIRVRPGDRISVSLYWQGVEASPDQSLHASLWLQAQNGPAHLAEQSSPIGPASFPVARWRPGEVVLERRQLSIGPEVPTGTYRLVLGVGDQQVDLGSVDVAGRPLRFDPPTAEGVTVVPAERNARWKTTSDAIALWGYRIVGPTVADPAKLEIELTWRALAPIGESYTAFVHLVGPDGQIWSQSDRLPLGGEAPTSGWNPGEYLSDRYTLQRKAGAPAGDYHLVAGWYLARTGERLQLPAGDAFEITRLPLPSTPSH